MLLSREFLPVLRESRAQTHTTMKRAHPHTETLQVLCITPPYGTHAFKGFFWTSKPASRVQLGSQKSKNLRTIPICNVGTLLRTVPSIIPESEFESSRCGRWIVSCLVCRNSHKRKRDYLFALEMLNWTQISNSPKSHYGRIGVPSSVNWACIMDDSDSLSDSKP